jgi:hypothetical protein
VAKKETEPLRGEKDIAQRVEKGEDPNADLSLSQAETKAQGALFLSMNGASWSDIARMQGYASPTHARLAVERVLAESAGPDDREQMREMNRRRYKRLLQSVMGKAVDPKDPQHLAYNARALAIIDRLGILDGLNAPQQVQITPTDQYLQDYLQRMLPEAQKDRDAGEADILDAEIIGEDGEIQGG